MNNFIRTGRSIACSKQAAQHVTLANTQTNCITNKAYSLRELLILRTLLVIATVFHMFSLSAQTPRKDSGANGLLYISGSVVSSVDGKPIQGVSIRVEGEKRRTSSKNDGSFSLQISNPKGTVSFSHVGFKRLETSYSAGVSLIVKLIPLENQLEEVEVVNTGFQKIPKERAAGSFELIDNKLLNKRMGTTILDRLENASVSTRFEKDYQWSDQSQYADLPQFNFENRGRTAMVGNTSRTIVLDNVLFEGDLRDINPNDIESVSILKDAVATSIWGTNGGGGVIVLTSKKGNFNNPFRLSLTSNLTVQERPDIYALPFMKSTDFIDYETYLFNNGYFNSKLNNKTSFPTLTPVVEILNKIKKGEMTAADGSRLIDEFRTYDIRDDYYNYVYRPSVMQQYALNLSGGNSRIAYNISAGLDDNKNSKYYSENNRKTLRISVKSNPIKNLNLNTDINYTHVGARDFSMNQEVSYQNSTIGQEWPYLRLTDGHGNFITSDAVPYRKIYRDTAGNGKLLDWTYNPLKEREDNFNKYRTGDLMINLNVSYKILPKLSIQGIYAYQTVSSAVDDWVGVESFSARNRINLYTQYNDKVVLRTPVPIGGILSKGNRYSNAHTGRIQLDYSTDLNSSNSKLDVLAGAEVRQKNYQSDDRLIYGYVENTLSFASMDFISLFPTLNRKTGGSRIQDGIIFEQLTNRYLSAFANANYTFKGRYILNGSVRQDASNLLGVKSNQKWQPLWSSGMAWIVSKEPFLKHQQIDLLKLRATYGFSGRVNGNYAALPIIEYRGNDELTGLRYANIATPANPSLRWERSQTINLAVDFAVLNNRLAGSFEWYVRNVKDLLANMQLDPTTGYDNMIMNGGQFRSKGFELTLNTVNVRTNSFSWLSTLMMSKNRTKVIKYGYKLPTADSYVYNSGSAGSFLLEGHDEAAVLAFPFAGLDPNTGDPQGYLNGELSKDYTSILYGGTDNLVDLGPGRPTYYGNIANEFSVGKFSIRFNIQGRFGYKFFRSTFSQISAADSRIGHPDYALRWQNPGDESKTDIPSLKYPMDSFRDSFFQKSDALVIKGDHIRLQDIYLSYDLGKWKGIRSLSVNAFLKNMNTILWRANKYGIDPEYRDAIPLPFSASFGVNVGF